MGLHGNAKLGPAGRRAMVMLGSIETYGQLEALDEPPYGERAVELRATGEMVGLVGVVPSMGPFGQLPGFGGIGAAERFRPEVGLYWGLAPAHRGRGDATEAAAALIDHGFREMRLARIVATTTATTSPRSRRCGA